MKTAKTVLITGGAGGIGRATAGEFARRGWTVLLSDRDEAGLAEARAELAGEEGEVHSFVVDVSNRQQVREMAQEVLERWGHLDVLINNAGIGYHGPMATTTVETWERLISINLWGPLNHIYAFLPGMLERGGGTIINVSSGQAFIRMPTWGAYAAIKAALGVMSEVLHYEVRDRGIHVGTVYPYMVNTPFYRDIETETTGGRLMMKLVPLYSDTPAKLGRLIHRVAMKRERIERVNIVNRLYFYGRMLPLVPELMGRISMRILARDDKDGLKGGPDVKAA